MDALDAAFYASFGNVEATGKRWLLALDVSGSMGWPHHRRDAGPDPAHRLRRDGDDHGGDGGGSSDRRLHAPSGWLRRPVGRGQSGLTPVPISPRQRLDDVLATTDKIPFGGTDCALPMVYALKNRIKADVFVVYTDSETWAGSIHPVQALREYRQRMGIPAKLVVVGMTSNGFTIADPDDAGMLDVVGFDTATPQLMSDFARSDSVGACHAPT